MSEAQIPAEIPASAETSSNHVTSSVGHQGIRLGQSSLRSATSSAVFVSDEVRQIDETTRERKKEKDLEIRIRAMAAATDADFKTPDEYLDLANKFYTFMKGASYE